MTISDKVLTIIVTIMLALGGWMLKIQTTVAINSQSIGSNHSVVVAVSDNQKELAHVIHKLDNTLNRFEGQFVTRDKHELKLKEIRDEIRTLSNSKR